MLFLRAGSESLLVSQRRVVQLSKRARMPLCLRAWSLLFLTVFGNSLSKGDFPRVSISHPNIRELDENETETEIDVTGGLAISCIAPYPLEWVLEKFDFGKSSNDADLVLGLNAETSRSFSDFWNSSTYQYKADFRVLPGHSQHFLGSLSCKNIQGDVASQAFGKTVTIAGGNDNRRRKVVLSDLATESPEESCTFLVQVTFNDNQYPGYHCEPTNKSFGPVTIKYFGFDFGMASVPLYSKYLMNQNCTTLSPDSTSCPKCMFDSDNEKFSPKMFLCFQDENAAGVVYFPRKEKPGHFFREPQEYLENLSWLKSPDQKVLYVGDELPLALDLTKSAKYLAKGDVYAVLKKDGLLINRTIISNQYRDTGNSMFWKGFFLDESFSRLGEAGNMELNLHFPLWNSSGWVNAAFSYIVKDLEYPHFDKETEIIRFTEGQENANINCVARGDPIPTITWKPAANASRVTANGGVLVFFKVTPLIENEYTCVASTRGRSAEKVFQVYVDPVRDTYLGKGYGPLEIAWISIGGGVILAFGIGLIVLYRKFQVKLTTELSKDEITEFREGNGGALTGDDSYIRIEWLPYNSKFELHKSRIFPGRQVLGSGEFGIVIKGEALFDGSTNRSPVAIKMVRKTADISHFKSLLSELRILAYLGPSQHLAYLRGAWTENIQNRELYVLTELCRTSLLTHLRSCKFKHGSTTALQPGDVTFENMIRWSAEIAKGMEFVSSQKIVHGDLAARNVLLSFDLKCKISDFGLARQLVNYQFIKLEQCPLPWKWMSVEALGQMSFSFKSDVWSFGVTLWEIFSLGGIPYPGLSWSTDFVQQLQEGLRMTIPIHATRDIFKTISKCWNLDPNDRPNFEDLKRVLEVKLVDSSYTWDSVDTNITTTYLSESTV